MELADAKLLVCRLTLFDQQSEVWKKQLFNKATSKGDNCNCHVFMSLSKHWVSDHAMRVQFCIL
jgi:hypothetical protein